MEGALDSDDALGTKRAARFPLDWMLSQEKYEDMMAVADEETDEETKQCPPACLIPQVCPIMTKALDQYKASNEWAEAMATLRAALNLL